VHNGGSSNLAVDKTVNEIVSATSTYWIVVVVGPSIPLPLVSFYVGWSDPLRVSDRACVHDGLHLRVSWVFSGQRQGPLSLAATSITDVEKTAK
jgi:hypothetical protein